MIGGTWISGRGFGSRGGVFGRSGKRFFGLGFVGFGGGRSWKSLGVARPRGVGSCEYLSACLTHPCNVGFPRLGG